MNGGKKQGKSLEFRRWSVLAFTLESLLVIATFLFLLFGLGWRPTETMAYVILVVMVFGALVNIFVFFPWYRKQKEGGNDRLPDPEHEPER